MNHMQNLASILVPVYNKQKYMKKCLNSLLGQSYDNLEIVVVDDGLTDTSLAICESYAVEDKRVHVFTQANKGVSSARNKLLSHAHGQYVF